MNLVARLRTVVGNDHALQLRIPGEVIRIAHAECELRRVALRVEAPDLAAIPGRLLRGGTLAVLADTDEDRAVRGDGEVPAVMLIGDTALAKIDVAGKLLRTLSAPVARSTVEITSSRTLDPIQVV